MIEIWWPQQISNMQIYHRIIRLRDCTKFEKKLKTENFQKISHFRGTDCRVEANNNRKALVVCARYVVKRT